MPQATEKKLSRYQFEFQNVERDSNLEKMANLKLAEILALAPKDALATGAVEINGRYYTATAEVKSRYRDFQEKAAGTTPYSAVRRALERLEDRLFRWRFGGGTDTSTQPIRHFSVPQIQG